MKPSSYADFDPDRAADEAALPLALRGRPRQPALRPPDTAYFDHLPAQVLTRIRATERAKVSAAPLFTLPSWPRLRLAFTSATLSGAFVLALWVGRPVAPPMAPTAAPAALLAGISGAELVEYLTAVDAPRVSVVELSNLVSLADADLSPALVPVSDAEVQQALGELPLDDLYL